MTLSTQTVRPAALENFRGTESILVVDDERLILSFTRSVLKHCGYNVYEFDDPNVALRERAKLKFDLVLTDVVMPGISGPELVKEIHASNPEIPCIFMSGFDAHEVAGRGVTDTCGYLRKPFTPETLVRRVRNTLEGHTHD